MLVGKERLVTVWVVVVCIPPIPVALEAILASFVPPTLGDPIAVVKLDVRIATRQPTAVRCAKLVAAHHMTSDRQRADYRRISAYRRVSTDREVVG